MILLYIISNHVHSSNGRVNLEGPSALYNESENYLMNLLTSSNCSVCVCVHVFALMYFSAAFAGSVIEKLGTLLYDNCRYRGKNYRTFLNLI